MSCLCACVEVPTEGEGLGVSCLCACVEVPTKGERL